MFNLKDPHNPDLRLKLIEGSLTPQILVTMDSK
jgi:hypothetical protein